jgi:hypothetical protein
VTPKPIVITESNPSGVCSSHGTLSSKLSPLEFV